jgi:hypothetical protein
MAAGTAEKPSAAELRKQKAEREAREAEQASNGRADVDEAALGAGDDGIDVGPQDVYDGDDEVPMQQLSFQVGGKRPTSTGLRLTGGKVDVPGSFMKGSKLVLRVEVRVGEVAFVDEHDPKTGQIIGCQRRHKARILNVAVES